MVMAFVCGGVKTSVAPLAWIGANMNSGGLAAGAIKNLLKGNANYQVPSGRTGYIGSIYVRAHYTSGSYSNNWGLVYADDAALTTNVVPLMSLPTTSSASPYPGVDIDVCLSIPGGKYLGVKNYDTSYTIWDGASLVVRGFEI